jgi:hypothetical protein
VDAAAKAHPLDLLEQMPEARLDLTKQTVEEAEKSSFSQLLCIMKPVILSITASTFSASHSPSREKGREGSARSKSELLTPGLSRNPRTIPSTAR